MRPGPALAAQLIIKYIAVDGEAIYLRDLLRKIVVGENWGHPDDVVEIVQKWENSFGNQVALYLKEHNWAGPFRPYVLVESVALRGIACPLPSDDDVTLKAKRRRARTYQIDEAVRRLHHTQVETVCKWMLRYLGCSSPEATRGSDDGGIDFYGRCDFDDFVQASVLSKGMEKQLKIWLVGQAKHYPDNPITTADIRELLGSTALARHKVFSSDDDPQSKLEARIADPIFSVFVTTGRFTSGSMELFRKSGVIAIDGLQLAQFLADNDVGLVDEEFNQLAFDEWVLAGPA